MRCGDLHDLAVYLLSEKKTMFTATATAHPFIVLQFFIARRDLENPDADRPWYAIATLSGKNACRVWGGPDWIWALEVH